MSNVAENNRCDRPGCLSRVTETYLVGLGGMPAFYCRDHAPTYVDESAEVYDRTMDYFDRKAREARNQEHPPASIHSLSTDDSANEPPDLTTDDDFRV